MFIDTHPKSMLQKVGLPNFVHKDVLNTKYIISILEAFHLLGLNVIYVILPGDDTHNNDFLCYDISNVLVKLKEINTRLCQLVIKKELHGFGINSGDIIVIPADVMLQGGLLDDIHKKQLLEHHQFNYLEYLEFHLS